MPVSFIFNPYSCCNVVVPQYGRNTMFWHKYFDLVYFSFFTPFQQNFHFFHPFSAQIPAFLAVFRKQKLFSAETLLIHLFSAQVSASLPLFCRNSADPPVFCKTFSLFTSYQHNSQQLLLILAELSVSPPLFL
ncbi:hypothetical protein AB8X72_15215 [Listeria monocytogenes]|uniref:hypothetical protein n=1 Tax=Listeria monocytogenes TaxID=1639 RepID=UPI00350E579D